MNSVGETPEEKLQRTFSDKHIGQTGLWRNPRQNLEDFPPKGHLYSNGSNLTVRPGSRFSTSRHAVKGLEKICGSENTCDSTTFQAIIPCWVYLCIPCRGKATAQVYLYLHDMQAQWASSLCLEGSKGSTGEKMEWKGWKGSLEQWGELTLWWSNNEES